MVQFVKKGPCLLIGEVLETPLQDAAPVRVRCQIVHAAAERCDKAQSFRWNELDQSLNHLNTQKLVTKHEA